MKTYQSPQTEFIRFGRQCDAILASGNESPLDDKYQSQPDSWDEWDG